MIEPVKDNTQPIDEEENERLTEPGNNLTNHSEEPSASAVAPSKTESKTGAHAQQAEQLTQQDKDKRLAELGNILKSCREGMGMSIADIASETRIQKYYIEAMESGALDILPKGPYTRSFLKQYCTHLNALELWESYDELTQDKKLVLPTCMAQPQAKKPDTEDKDQNYAKEPKIFKKRSFIWLYAVVLVSLYAAAWITWQYRGELSKVAKSPVDGGTTSVAEAPPAASTDTQADLGWMDGKPPKEQTPEETQATGGVKEAAAQPTEASSDAKDPAAPVTPTPGDTKEPAAADTTAQPVANNTLRITANSVIWIKVSNKDNAKANTLFQGLLQPGQSKEFTATDVPLRVRYGNPIKTAIIWNGQTTDPVDAGKKPVTRYYHPDGTVTDKN